MKPDANTRCGYFVFSEENNPSAANEERPRVPPTPGRTPVRDHQPVSTARLPSRTARWPGLGRPPTLGGWEDEDTPGPFAAYCGAVFSALGPLIPYACTINEADIGQIIRQLLDTGEGRKLQREAVLGLGDETTGLGRAEVHRVGNRGRPRPAASADLDRTVQRLPSRY